MPYDPNIAQSFIEKQFIQSVIPSLSEFIAIPNLSRLYDPQYQTNGLLRKAAEHMQKWTQSLDIQGLKTEILQNAELTPLLFIEIEGDIKEHTILFYGHFDKQPHMTGWDQNKGPTKPVIQNNRLYGRGSNDDGYNLYSSMLAVKSVQQQGIPLPSNKNLHDMLGRLKLLRDRLGNLDIIFCLDSGCEDQNRLWITKSLRGFIDFVVNIKTLRQGVHSGDSSGIVPSVFKVFNMLISRLEDLQTGKIHDYFHVDIPAQRYAEIYSRVQSLAGNPFDNIGVLQGLSLVSNSNIELYLNSSWKPQLTVTGIDGIPPISSAGNVMVPQMNFKLSLRVPPTFDCQKGIAFLRNLLTQNVPYGAKVTLSEFDYGNGWNAVSYDSWFQEALQKTSTDIFGSQYLSSQEGGSIPVVNIISKFWPTSQMVVTGSSGPDSGAHGPNEYLDIPHTIKLTRAVSQLIAVSCENWQFQKNQ